MAYRPDPESLAALAAGIAPEVGRLYLFANGPLPAGLREDLARLPRARIIDAPSNLGIGVALNGMAVAALLEGYDRLILFDQDSQPRPGLVAALDALWQRLKAEGMRPSALGPRLVAAAGADSKPPRYRPVGPAAAGGAARPVAFLPTSGSLVDLAVLRRTGFFRADYFIDAVDTEWCFRAAARGHRCYLAETITMDHSVGTGTVPLPLGLTMPRQKPFRMYCYLRNNIHGLRLRHVPAGWKLRQIPLLALQAYGYARAAGFAPSAMGPLWRGLVDGLRGRLGEPPPESGYDPD